jgi:hypothetical protein
MVRSPTWVRLSPQMRGLPSFFGCVKFRARWRVVDVHGEDEFVGPTVVLDGEHLTRFGVVAQSGGVGHSHHFVGTSGWQTWSGSGTTRRTAIGVGAVRTGHS